MSTKSYLSVQEIAQTLDVSPFTVHTWIRTGKLSATKIGKAYRISKQDFEDWWGKQGARPKKTATGEELEPELSSLYQAWLLELANGTKPCKATTVNTHRAHFLKYVRILVDTSAEGRLTYRKAVNAAAISSALVRIPAKNFASRYNTYSAVMNFAKFLVRRGLLDPKDREAMKEHKPRRLLPPKKTVLHSKEDLDRLFEAILMHEAYTGYEKALNAALAGTMAFAGLRVSEVAQLEVEHVDFDSRLIHVFHAKGGHPRLVGMTERLKRLLEEYTKVRPSVGGATFFLGPSGRPLNRQLIGGRIKRISQRAGMKITPHGLRRTFATLNANAGRSLNMIQLALGHKDLSTTQEYLMADNRMAAYEMRNW